MTHIKQIAYVRKQLTNWITWREKFLVHKWLTQKDIFWKCIGACWFHTLSFLIEIMIWLWLDTHTHLTVYHVFSEALSLMQKEKNCVWCKSVSNLKFSIIRTNYTICTNSLHFFFAKHFYTFDLSFYRVFAF